VLPSSTLVLAVVLLYLGACLAVGLWPGRRATKTADGYVAGDRSLGVLLLYFITGATIFSSFAFLGGPGWAHSRGAAAFYILGYGALGFVPFYFLGPRAARLGRAYGFVTQAEMAAARFRSPLLAAVMATVSVIALVPYLAVQMKGAGLVLSAVTRGAVPGWAGAAAVYLVVLVYVWRSGVLGVGWTNTFQGIFMMALAWGLGLYLPYRLHGGVGAMFDRLAEARPELLLAPGLTAGGAPWTWGEYSTAILMSAVGFSVWPHLFMKAFTARSVRTIRLTAVLYPTFQVFLVPLFLIGFSGVLFEPPPPVPDQVLPHLLMNMEIPALLVGLFCAGALAASMSSGDAMAHASASILVRDGLMAAAGRRLDPGSQRRIIRWLVVAVLAVAYAVAVGSGASLVALLLYAYGPVAQLAPAVLATLYWRGARGAGVVAGLVAGALVTVLLSAWPELRPWPLHAGLYGLALNLTLLVLVSRLGGEEAAATDREFLAVAAGKGKRPEG
jgi:SSS family solute:Na+ symporter